MSDIFAAISDGDVERVRELAPDQGSARNADGVSALMLARYHGGMEAVEAIRPHAGDLDVFEAATLGDLERLRGLLDGDASLATASSADGYTALHYACFFDGAEAARLLVERGADVERVATGENKVAPLQSAAAARNVEAARVLLDAGADVNCRDEGSFTPLHSAAQNGDVELAELLLERGADASAQLGDGRTPRDLAASDEVRELL